MRWAPTGFVLGLISLGLVPRASAIEPPNTAQATAGATAWQKGKLADPGFFPIAVWLQDPRNAQAYKKAGINLYVGLWRGPTDAQLDALRDADMGVICHQNRAGLARKADPTILAWMHGDEPDNAQEVVDPKTGRRGYGPPIPPARIVAGYERLKATDPSRPVLLNLGQGVANDEWVGRGPGATLEDYPAYVKGADIVSFDVYPVAGIEKPDGQNYLWYVPKGIDRLMKWTDRGQAIWCCIEASRVSNPKAKVSPQQLRAEVWMAIIHGARGLIYFVHQFRPRFNEHALLDDPELLQAATAINRQIHELAPVLNSPTQPEVVSVQSSDPKVPIDLLVKRHGGKTYLFAVGMRNAPARGSFTIRGLTARTKAEVLGESRAVEVTDGKFEDAFTAHAVHTYVIGPDRHPESRR